MNRFSKIFTGLLPVLLFTCVLSAAEPTKEELRVRFEARYGQILSLKSEGKLGETQAGLLEAVTPAAASDAAVSSVIQEENSDRRALYRLLAQETGADAGEVAKRNALRIYGKARPGDYLKGDDGAWYRK